MAYTHKAGDTTTTIINLKEGLMIRIENVRTGECMSSLIPPDEIGELKWAMQGTELEQKIEQENSNGVDTNT